SADARPKREERAREGLPRERRRRQAIRRRGDVQGIEPWTAEGDTGRLRHRQIDHPIDSPPWVVAHDPPGRRLGQPVAAFVVERSAIRYAVLAGEFEKEAAVAQCSLDSIEVPGPNLPSAAVAVVDDPAVRTEGERVGSMNSVDQASAGPVGVK